MRHRLNRPFSQQDIHGFEGNEATAQNAGRSDDWSLTGGQSDLLKIEVVAMKDGGCDSGTECDKLLKVAHAVVDSEVFVERHAGWREHLEGRSEPDRASRHNINPLFPGFVEEHPAMVVGKEVDTIDDNIDSLK